METFTSTISSLSSQIAELKNIQWELPAEFLDLPHLVSSIQEKLKTLNSLPGATTMGVPLADKATASPAEGEKDADTNLKNELVYREDGTAEVIEKFKASDLQLAEWREVPSASALQVLRRLGSIFTSVYAAVQKLKKALGWSFSSA
ncbi:hypothetical protein Tco_1064047 [Tanacetum coccineum]